MTCEQAQQIAFAGGSRSEHLRAKLHLTWCRTCRAAVQAARTIADALAAVPAPAPPEALVTAWRKAMPETARRPRRRRRWALALAPVVVLGLWLGGHYALHSRSSATTTSGSLASEGGRCLAVLDDPLVASDVYAGGAWFPDGRAIAYTTISDRRMDADLVEHGTRRLWRLDLATGEKRLLAEESGMAVIGGMQVSPTGDHLVYFGGQLLKVIDLHTGALAVVPKSFVALRGAWSPDGTRLAFARNAGNDEFGRFGKDILADRGIWVWRVADGELTKVAPFPEEAETPGQGRLGGPYWSPDGEWLAFLWQTEERTEQSELFAFQSEIRLVHPDGSGLRSVTTIRREGLDPGLLGSQCWSPDSRSLVFSWREAVGEPKSERNAQTKSWMPRPDAYVDRGITMLDVTTGEMTPLVSPDTLGPGSHVPSRVTSRPAWSPSGNAVAFTAEEPAQHTTSLYAVATRGRRVLTVAKGTEEARYSSPTWSPDGQSLLYVKIIQSPGKGDIRAELWLTRIGEAE